MAKLHRMVRLEDRQECCVFTFLTPSQPLLNRSSLQDTFNCDFDFGNHRWTFSMVRNGEKVDMFVILKSVSGFLTVEVDVAFTLINQDHYTRNEKGRLVKVKYSSENFKHGLKNFCGLEDLEKGNFSVQMASEWFIVEVEMKVISSLFQETIKINADNPKQPCIQTRYETSYFSFGNFDWSLLLFPNGDVPETEGVFVISVCRHSSFDSICKIKFEVSVEMMSGSNAGSSIYQSEGIVEAVVDAFGRSRFSHSLQKLTSHSTKLKDQQQMNVRLVLKSCSAVGEVTLRPFVFGKNRGRLYDRDEQAWTLETDISMERFLIRLLYDDVTHVPRGHVRRVTWCLSLVPALGQGLGVGAKNMTVGGANSSYYVQTDADQGHTIFTEIPTAELRHSGVFLEEKDGGQMTLHLDWIESHLLFIDRWQLADDIIFKQRHQMRQELLSLEKENQCLEGQMAFYKSTIDERTHPFPNIQNPTKKKSFF